MGRVPALGVKRIFVEKEAGFNIEAQGLYEDLRTNLGIQGLKSVRIVNRYDIEGMSEEEYAQARDVVFCEPPVDHLYEESLAAEPDQRIFAIEYLPGQYDQRADSAAQCVQIITRRDKPVIRVAKLVVLEGDISEEQFQRIKEYCINPVESREASLDKPVSLDLAYEVPDDVAVVKGFTSMNQMKLKSFWESMGFAMTLEDLKFCREYFAGEEHRDPTMTELKVIDTYWSDHCRHTTFLTGINNVEFEKGFYTDVLKSAYDRYQKARSFVYTEKTKQESLMDIATIAMKKMKKQGLLKDLDESDEINACSISVNVDVDGKEQEWLVMFKNETHNHPTEIEPFGGAATCLGGAIRDPLSGRSYVYQAMRVTGSGDPRTPVEKTIPGKLPQRKITTGAAAGYSSYGNQIGLATGQVAEVYHPGYVAKRMEIGAVIGAAPKENIVRCMPEPGDVVILLGGQTGRDGCGGATGSSKAHTEESLSSCGAEVQKGNPPTERKIQRLFRDPQVTRMIKKCNDFGAGGVSVAIGELAPGLDINLDVIPKKYEGLDGTELAISESQERMAVVLAPEHTDLFIQAARKENLEATIVAEVKGTNRLRMIWRGKGIVDINRDFLDTNGMEQYTDVYVSSPSLEDSYFNKQLCRQEQCTLKERWLNNLQSLNVCSQRGLAERFDSTIGAGTVLMPFGGKYQLTPAEGMAAKIPVRNGETNTATLMTFGFNPAIASWSPFHGAVYAVLEAVARITAMGGDYRKVRLTLQEYFERLGSDPKKWGKPFSALLGALYAQEMLGIPAIGGKDSMSGTFEDLAVPPTLTAFAVCTANADSILSPEFKSADSKVILVRLNLDDNHLPNFDQLERNYTLIHRLVREKKIAAAHSVRGGGMAEAVSKMCFGSRIGFAFQPMGEQTLFQPLYGSILLEIPKDEDQTVLFEGMDHTLIGYTQEREVISVNQVEIPLEQAQKAWESPLEPIFPSHARESRSEPKLYSYEKRSSVRPVVTFASPRVFIPVFPGTNCEYDSARAFEKAGGRPDVMVVRNLTSREIEDSLKEMAQRIGQAQIIMIPGGFSGGDEPDGSGKFIAAAFRNPWVKHAVMELLQQRDGLILGICNGFQALIKLGLVPYGEIREIDDDSPTLTFNTIGKHVSRLVRTRVASVLSPWLSHSKVGEIHTIPISHGEGRFIADRRLLEAMAASGQIATQYVDSAGNPARDPICNPNGSIDAIEGITSPDGRVFGKMGHSERIGNHVAKNVPGNKDQLIFQSGVDYFK
jgi:phosphoribosylformylglycinamidine synthase